MTLNPFALTLRQILLVDAATCTAMGLLLAAAAGPLAGLTGIPQPLLFYAGVLLFPVALFMAAVAARTPVNAPAVWLVIAGNVAWIAASFALFGMISPNGLGAAFIVAQALAVVLFVLIEHAALRASRHPAGLAA